MCEVGPKMRRGRFKSRFCWSEDGGGEGVVCLVGKWKGEERTVEDIPNAARIAAYRFDMSVCLLDNICLWKDILVFRIMEQLAPKLANSASCVQSIPPNIHDRTKGRLMMSHMIDYLRIKTRKLYFPWNATRGMGCLEWEDAHHC
ncbi:hypothetical protein C5167_040781 [Papaver somniferum]|uniref:Uncharacterized protein n=1 Tax=Papaver somniferum TaxID=3469 RepID=A0A4Y7IG35_PAPSO|nr:hypothetical protein C5167_040781 [Papaver somniferum]